jgi:methylmalonyl-CoA mutase
MISLTEIHKNFKTPSYLDWYEAACAELNGVDPSEKLKVLKKSLEILPYYSSDIETTNQVITLKPSPNLFHGARSWMNLPKVRVSDNVKANQLALDYLNSGADGILFDCTIGDIKIDELLNSINPEFCQVSFELAESSKKILNDFAEYTQKKYDVTAITGFALWKSFPKIETSSFEIFSSWNKFYPITIPVEESSDVTLDIAKALSNGVTIIEQSGITPETVLNQISFSVSLGTDFFLNITKLKTLRSLWYQVAGAYSCPSQTLHIHAFANKYASEKYQPHENMISSTLSSISAILGGCDSIILESEDINNKMANRIALNVSNLLREESHLNKTSDATAGSYFLNSMIDQLSQKAWTEFQKMI